MRALSHPVLVGCTHIDLSCCFTVLVQYSLLTGVLPCCCVQVKRLPDSGTPGDSCVINGVVAKKNVANRRMRGNIDSPRVLLLAGALEYQRVANKLSSFDTLLDQVRHHYCCRLCDTINLWSNAVMSLLITMSAPS